MMTAESAMPGIEDMQVLAGTEQSQVEQQISGIDVRTAALRAAGVVAAGAAMWFLAESARLAERHNLTSKVIN